SSETRQRYISIIDGILAKSDINLISAKRIRKELQDAVGEDLSSNKDAIKELIMQRFDAYVAAEEEANRTETPPQHSDADVDATDSMAAAAPKRSAANSEVTAGSEERAAKKKRRNSVESDAALAAKLQAEENLTRRQTRGAGSREATTPKKKTKKIKSAKKMNDENEVEASDEAPIRNTGFHKPMALSPALSSLLDGVETLSRPQTVKKLWQYIRAHDLQDPADRRQIRCDDKMKAVFKQDRVHMFTLNKSLAQNLHDI
ncbi:hypothetical protein KEM54_002653, partial [Ascosphaera aggregata]